MTSSRRIWKWRSLVGSALGILLVHPASAQENKVVRGTLLSTEGNVMQVKQADGKQAAVFVSPKTTYRVSAKGPVRLLSVGAWVRVQGHVAQGETVVIADSLSLVLTQQPERPIKGILQPGDKAVSVDFYGVVDNLNPLRVQADQGSAILTTEPGKAGVGTINIGGQTMELKYKGEEIALDFGDNLAMAGKEPQVQAHLYDQQAGTATSVWVTRVEPLDLDKLPAKKKQRKKR